MTAGVASAEIRAARGGLRRLGHRIVARRCSFCRREESAAERLVAGASAYICDACISQCVVIPKDHGGFVDPAPTFANPPTR